MTALTAQEVAERIANGGPIQRSGASFKVLCPNHPDKNPSLSIRAGDIQPILMKCHAGCDTEHVLKAAGLEMSDLFGEEVAPDYAGLPKVRGAAIERIYVYRDEAGVPLFEVIRLEGKGFTQRRKDETKAGGYDYSTASVRKVPYRLPEALRAIERGEVLWIAEGEKDVHALYHAGVTATCNAGGAGKWTDAYSEMFAGATVTIVADRDIAGQEHARAVRESLVKYDCTVRIVEAHPDVQGKGADAYDHLHMAKKTIADFVETVPYEGLENRASLALDLDEFVSKDRPERVFVIPHTLARGEILGVTGFEGMGKSTLLKQMGVCCAAGINPFSLADMPPQRVLHIDCENPEDDMVEDFRWLRRMAEKAGKWGQTRERLYVIPQGAINLESRADVEWLLERVHAHRPDLLVIGPLYNMVDRDLSSEDNVRAIMKAINAARNVHGSAVVWEHHVPLGQGGAQRNVRPIGSSLLLRWPNFGFGLLPVENDPDHTMVWQPWRGARRRDRHWPSALMPGGKGNWPWVETA